MWNITRYSSPEGGPGTNGTVVPGRKARSLLGALLLALMLVITVTACEPAPPPPTPGTVDIAGDSVSQQAFGYTTARPGVTARANTEMVRWGWGCHDVEATLRRHVAAARPAVLIWALGPNDADPARGGWALDDMACWMGVFEDLHPSTCLVVVLPGYGAGMNPVWADEIDEARDYIPGMIAGRERTVTRDWQPLVDANPHFMVGDGIHKANAEAAEARLALYDHGARACPGGAS